VAVDMFLELDWIKGEALDAKHKDKIDVLAWSWGMSQSGTAHMGFGSGAGKLAVQDLSLTKYVDKSSAALVNHCCTGKHLAKGQLTVRKAGDKPLEYVIIEFKDIIITTVSGGGSGSVSVSSSTSTRPKLKTARLARRSISAGRSHKAQPPESKL